MTIKVLEHNGIYTAYRRIMKRSDDGHLYESVKRIDFPFPPTDESNWQEWSVALTPDALDVGMQIFFDKWNFGNGSPQEGELYQCLCNEDQRRKAGPQHGGQVTINAGSNVVVGRSSLATSSGDQNVAIGYRARMNFPLVKK